MKQFAHFTLKEFLTALSQKTPVPGGGAVAALCAASAVGLISMAAGYALGKGKAKGIEARIKKNQEKSLALQERLLELVDLDAQAYLAVVQSRSQSAGTQRLAKRAAAAVPREVARLCRQALSLTPLLVQEGSPFLVSDIEVAIELLYAAHQAALINVRVNQ